MPAVSPTTASTALALVVAATLAPAAQAGGADWLPKDWQAGAFVLAAPRYEGAKSYRVIGVPLIAPFGVADGDSRFQFKGPDDLRLRLVSLEGFEIGPVAGWRFGRDEDDGRRLEGLGDIDGGLVAGAYAAYRISGLTASVSYHHQVTGDDTGGLVRFGLEATSRIQPWLTLTGLIGANWASDDYMQSFFGVSADQAARSGLARFDAESGFKDVHLGLTAAIPLDDRWTLRVMGRYTHLVGDAADSPIVERESQLTGGLGLTYRFSIR